MDTLRLDLIFALRLLRRNATFAASVIATLAIGIGAATTMFGVVRGVLLEPLPIRDQNRIVVLRKEQLVGNEALVPFSVRDQRAFATATRTLELVAGSQYDGAWPSVVRDGDRVLTPATAVVSGDFFQALGIRPTLGRVLEASDDVVGGTAAVIGYSFWRQAFGADSSVIGRTVWGNGSGKEFRIVGVMPRGFAFPGKAEMWVPVLMVMPEAMSNEGQWPFNLVGRLRVGATADQARAELATFLSRKSYAPGEPRDVRATARPIASLIVGNVRPALLALASAVCLLLLIANVNVANLFIVRGIARRRELAVRTAVGASRWRIGRQLATEGMILATLGGAGGIILARWLLRLLVAIAPAELPRADSIRVSPAVLAAAAVMVALSALLIGVLPAIDMSRRKDLTRALRSGARAGTGDSSSRRTQAALVVAQIALAIVVLVGAGLLVRTVAALEGLDMGFAVPELSGVELSFPSSVASSRVRLAAFYQSMTERLEGMPGVSSATALLVPPFSGRNGWDAFYTADGQTEAECSREPGARSAGSASELLLDHGRRNPAGPWSHSCRSRRERPRRDREPVVRACCVERAGSDRQAIQVRTRQCANAVVHGGRRCPGRAIPRAHVVPASRIRPMGTANELASAHVHCDAWRSRTLTLAE